MSNKHPMWVDIHVGQRVRALRRARGMSQTDLGTKLGITFQQVQKYEKGTNRVGASRLHAMCVALDCGYDDLLPAVAQGQPTKGVTLRVALGDLRGDVDNLVRQAKAVAKQVHAVA